MFLRHGDTFSTESALTQQQRLVIGIMLLRAIHLWHCFARMEHTITSVNEAEEDAWVLL